jgi:hypothetical protein
LSIETRLPWLPVDARYRCLIEHKERGHAGPDRDREIGCRDLFHIKLDHHVFGDLPAFGGTILETIKPVLHFGDPALESCCQGFICQSRANDCRDDLVQIGQTFDRIGEGLFVDLGVFRLDPVTDGTVGDGGNGRKFSEQVRQLGIRERVTAPQSPSQNTYVERTIWSIRRECLNHILVMSERHLRRISASYVDYYNHSRVHQALDLDCPVPRASQRISDGKVIATPQVRGLHHRYERRAL